MPKVDVDRRLRDRRRHVPVIDAVLSSGALRLLSRHRQSRTWRRLGTHPGILI
jgi:hypothetical protein